jgi:hypothetical protein
MIRGLQLRGLPALTLHDLQASEKLTDDERLGHVQALGDLIASGKVPVEFVERWQRVDQLLKTAQSRRVAS